VSTKPAAAQIEWTPPKSAAAIIQGRQENIIDKEVALSNSVWARDNLSDLNSAESQPKESAKEKPKKDR
jgi:hypothetical protein